MKSVLTKGGVVFAAGLLSSFQAIAQHPPMQVPSAPQAIEMHLEQERVLKQRDAIEVKKSRTATATKPTASGMTNATTGTGCDGKAIDENGKVLRGAAKVSYLHKCASDAK